ncbi:hypothetical protein ACF0H5_012377 [Mactra antiquata]
MAFTKKSVILTLCVLALNIGFCNSALSSIVLHSQTVTAGQSATFSCMSSGSGQDPTITWALVYDNGTTISNNLASSYTGGTEDGNDGAITSSVTFFVQSSYVSTDSNAPGVRLWCYGQDSVGTSMSIYTTLRTDTTTSTASLGGTCSSTVTCSTVNSYCNTNLSPSQCNCNTNYYDSNGVNVADGSCIAKAGLGGTCQAGNDNSCGTTYAVCSSSSPFVCVCGSTFTQSGTICVPNSANLGESCINPSKSCPANATCSTTCQCLSGFTASSGTCVADSAAYGQSCTNPARLCVDEATCINGICQCNSSFVYSTSFGSCISSSASYGQSCTNPTRTCLNDATCISGVCQCGTGFVYSSSSGSCISDTATYGQSCINPTRTCLNDATCISGVCQCGTGFVYSSSSGSCISNTATYGQSCTNPTRTCLNDATCISGVCQCGTGFVYSSSSGSCISDTASYGQACINPTRTCLNDATCISGVCQCGTGFVYSSSSGSCISSSATYGQSCINPTRTCLNDATCISGVCQCGTGLVYSSSSGSCISDTATYGQSCINPTRTCLNDATCISGVCQCGTGFVYSSSSGSCISSSAGYGQSCINPTRSCPNNAECTNGVCECSSNYVYSSSSGTCISSSAGIGDSCTNPTRQCPTNAVCGTNNLCQCSTGYVTSGNTCSIPGLGQSCSASVGCQTTTSGSTSITLQCVNNVCTCPGNYYTLNNACIQKHALGQSCSSSVSNSCLDSAANCPSGIANPTCQCNSGYTATSGVCVQDTSSSCPSGTNSPSIVTGVSSPAESTTPNVWVEQTCYTVNLLDTQVMRCKDTKAGNLRAARWIKLPNSVVVASTGSFINGDRTNPNLTVSSAQASYAGFYICQLCYANNFVRCTNSSNVQLIVVGTAITASTVSISPSITPTKGSQVTMSCGTTPIGAATSYTWFKGNAAINGANGATYVISFVQASNSGSYVCRATNTYGSIDSSAVTLNVLYAPEFSLPGGGTTDVIVHDFNAGDLTLTCDMTGNPAITRYYFYDASNTLLANITTNTYSVTSSQGYQTYYCLARNSVGLSNQLSFEVQEPGGTGNVGAATENTGIGTGTIAAIVLGWCRKREKVEQQPPPPAAKPYIPRTIVSANSTVTRKDVGIMMDGHDLPVSEYEEPRYTTPRYHLKPAKNAGPIISMYDDGYEQPRAHQLPALDTQYLYTDEEPRKRHKKKRKRRHREHREPSPRRHDYEPAEPVNLPPSDEDLVVVPGKQNFMDL